MSECDSKSNARFTVEAWKNCLASMSVGISIVGKPIHTTDRRYNVWCLSACPERWANRTIDRSRPGYLAVQDCNNPGQLTYDEAIAVFAMLGGTSSFEIRE